MAEQQTRAEALATYIRENRWKMLEDYDAAATGLLDWLDAQPVDLSQATLKVVVASKHVPQERMKWEHRGWDSWSDLGPIFDDVEDAKDWLADRNKRVATSNAAVETQQRIVHRTDTMRVVSE